MSEEDKKSPSSPLSPSSAMPAEQRTISGSSAATTIPPPPEDKFKIVYFIFYFLGMGSLLPWNYFISMHGYWMYKYRNVTADIPTEHFSNMTDEAVNGTAAQPLTPLQLNWNSDLSIASMIPNVTFLLLNAAFGHKFKTKPRLIVAMIIIIFACVFNAVMTLTDTDHWQMTFLGLTLLNVVVVNIMVAILQGGLSGVAAKFPPSYMGSVVQGQALGGIFAATTNVLFLAMGADHSMGAFCCFLISILFLSLALLSFLIVTRTNFFKYYFHGPTSVPNEASTEQAGLLSDQDKRPGDTNVADVPVEPAKPKINVIQIAGQIWLWIVAVFLNFLITLAVFPAVASLVVSESHGNAWSDIYFIPVGCFLLFNIGDYLGRLSGSWIQWPKNTKYGAMIAFIMASSRIAFIPLFLFCNASPANRFYTEAYITSDVAYVILVFLFAVSNGYIGTVTMIFAPKMLPDGDSQASAAATMVSFLVLGLACGSLLSSATLLLL